MALKEALDLRLRLKPARCEAFKPFLQHRGDRFAPEQNAIAVLVLAVAVSKGCGKWPKTLLHPRPHAVACLLGVLFALMLGDAGEQMLDQLSIRVLAELDGRAFKPRAGCRNGASQINMRPDAPRKTRNVVDDDDVLFRILPAAQKAQHVLNAGPLDQAARDRPINEDTFDAVTSAPGIFAAAHFLRFHAVAVGGLLHAAYAAIDDGLAAVVAVVAVVHESSFAPL